MSSEAGSPRHFLPRPGGLKRFLLVLGVGTGLSGPLTLVLAWWASKNPAAVEGWFSRGLFRVWKAVPPIPALGSVPVGEVLSFLFPLLLIFFFFRGLFRLVFPSDRHPRWNFFPRLGKSLAVLGCTVSALTALFFWSWGFNYQRQSWAVNHGWSAPGGTSAELGALVDRLGHRASQLRLQLPQDSEGRSLALTAGSWSAESVGRRVAGDAYIRSSLAYPLLLGGSEPSKPFFWPEVPSYLGIGGLYFPWTGEALVNHGPADWSLPFAQAHENAHKRGWAREDEANFIAYLVLSGSGQADLEYSAALTAFLYAGSALASQGGEGMKTWGLQMSALDEGVKRDLRADQVYWQRFQGPVQEAAQSVNDAYLKGQGQGDGVKSYGRMVDLLLAQSRLHP